MAKTTISTSFGKSQILLDVQTGTNTVWGTLGEDLYPGQWVMLHTDNKWYKADADTAAHKLLALGVAGFNQRIRQSTMAELTIDDVYDITYAEDQVAPIHIAGNCIAFVTDQGATLPPGTPLMISGTGGSATILAQEATGASGGTAIRSVICGYVSQTIVDDDTKAIVSIGKPSFQPFVAS